LAWQWGEGGRQEQPLDFTEILHRQIWEIMQAKNENDVNKYIRSVENFEDLLISKTTDDKLYNEDIEVARVVFKERTKKLSPANSQDQPTFNRERELFSRSAFCALIKLIERAGFLPKKEVEGVISAYDGKLVNKLIELEQAGKEEITDEELAILKADIVAEDLERKMERTRKIQERLGGMKDGAGLAEGQD